MSTTLVLADRIRSTLGPLEKRLDLPHIHVMVHDHIALLHGDVGSYREVDEIDTAVAAVSGVAGVDSWLHVGLIAGDTRPSTGRAVVQPSDARHAFLGAATEGGLADRERLLPDELTLPRGQLQSREATI